MFLLLYRLLLRALRVIWSVLRPQLLLLIVLTVGSAGCYRSRTVWLTLKRNNYEAYEHY